VRSRSYSILKIAPAAHADIEARIRMLGPAYNSMFTQNSSHDLVILLDNAEVGLVKDDVLIDLQVWDPKTT